MDALFEPIRLRNKEIKNRLSKGASGETCASVDGFVTEDYVEIHREEDVYRGYGLVTDRNLKEFTIKNQVSGRLKEPPGKEDE